MPDNLWPVLGVGALVVAGIFMVFVPGAEKVNALDGLRFVIARWFHSLVWVLLAASFFMRGTAHETMRELANPVAMLGGLAYVVYIVTFMQVK